MSKGLNSLTILITPYICFLFPSSLTFCKALGMATFLACSLSGAMIAKVLPALCWTLRPSLLNSECAQLLTRSDPSSILLLRKPLADSVALAAISSAAISPCFCKSSKKFCQLGIPFPPLNLITFTTVTSFVNSFSPSVRFTSINPSSVHSM